MTETSTTAIVGVGNIGSAVARHLSRGGESIVLAANDRARVDALAKELGPLARGASVEEAGRRSASLTLNRTSISNESCLVSGQTMVK